MSEEDVLGRARELLERSTTLSQEPEQFFQRQAEQGLEFELSQPPEDAAEESRNTP